MPKAKVMVITSDRVLVQDLTAGFGGRDYELFVVPAVREAAVNLGAGTFAAVIADASRMPPADRDALLRIHRDKPFPLFLLDTLATLSPTEALPLRRISWPFPPGFADQVRAVEKPVVFLVDQALFTSRALQIGLQQAGVQPVSLESVMGLSEILLKAPGADPRATPRARSLWERLGGGGGEASSQGRSVVVAQFVGSMAEAEAFDGRLRQAVPAAACYYVFSTEPVRAALAALRDGQPAALLREQATRVPQVLLNVSLAPALAAERWRILLMDNVKARLERLQQSLMAKGYEVAVTMDGGEAIRLAAQKKGAFHVAVVGTALDYVRVTGREIAERLRAADPELGMIFMVDPVPQETVVRRISEITKLGVSQVLIKPLEGGMDQDALPGQLLYAVEEAINKIQMRRTIVEQKEELERINGFQKKFFAMVAHDVKNPLTAILGYSEVLSMKLKAQPETVKFTSHIHSAAKTLNLLISDLVDLAAIESGKLRVNIGPMDLPQVLQEVRSRIEVAAQQRQIRFSVQCPDGLPQLSGDPNRVGQVIQNLCTNGIQYTKEGGSVTVKVDASPQWVTVSVIDTGIGIKKEDLPRVFERFFQTQEAQAMRKAGFGLGLKISREIVQMHGGDIGIESEYGKGSRFYFTIPVPKQAAAPPPAPAPATPPSAPPAPPAPYLR